MGMRGLFAKRCVRGQNRGQARHPLKSAFNELCLSSISGDATVRPLFWGVDSMNRFFIVLATTLLTGYAPFAPGTVGAAMGVLLYWLLSPLPHHVYIPTVAACIFIAVWVADRACIIFGERDPSKVTIDEVVGMLVTFVLHPFSWVAVIAGFVLFRLFDILKPWPIRWAQCRFPGGWGVVLDDVLAGIFANAALWGVMWGLIRLGIAA